MERDQVPLPPALKVTRLESQLVVPPTALRNIINKTAQFVAKNGADMELRMRREQNAEERFGFLFPHHVFHPYYQERLQKEISGESTDAADSSAPKVPKAVLEVRKKQEEQKEKKQRLLMLNSGNASSGEESEEDDNHQPYNIFTPLKPPSSLKLLDLRIIKLTAEFAAQKGAYFISGLAMREKANSQFEFLRPNNPAHGYFLSLVETYRKLVEPVDRNYQQWLKIVAGLNPPPNGWVENASPEVKAEAAELFFFKHIQRRWKRERKLTEERLAREKIDSEERAAMNAINWDSMVVVDTIVFTEEDKVIDLPEPRNLYTEPMMIPSIPIPPAPPIDVTTPGISAPTVLPPPRRRKVVETGSYQKCPITGQMVKLEDFEKHLKVVLLNPQWKEQKNNLVNRARREAMWKPEADIEQNLVQFVTKRPDLFGSVEDELQKQQHEGSAVEPMAKKLRLNDI